MKNKSLTLYRGKNSSQDFNYFPQTLQATREMAEEHYIEHKNEHFFNKLMDYMTSTPLMPMIWEGPNAIKIIRNMLGVHDPTRAVPGTIRGDYSIGLQNNVIHGSDSPEAAKREINIWFHKNEIMPHTDSDC